MKIRNIKYRAWRTWDNRMIYDEVSSCISFRDNGEIETCSAIPLQFTGLRDKTGKELYEGDIVKLMWNHSPEQCPEYGSIYWHEEYAQMMGLTLQNEPFSFIGPNLSEVEIIGNIYENPELLTK